MHEIYRRTTHASGSSTPACWIRGRSSRCGRSWARAKYRSTTDQPAPAEGAAHQLPARPPDQGRADRLLLRRATRCCTWWAPAPLPASIGRCTCETGRIVAVKVAPQAVSRRQGDDGAVRPRRQDRHEAAASRHRADLRSAGAALADSDHGVRRGQQPPRVLQGPQEAGAAGRPAGGRRCAGAAWIMPFTRHDPPRPEDVERADHQSRPGQAGRFWPGGLAGRATTRGMSKRPIRGRSTMPRWSGPRACGTTIRAATCSSSA